jgi:phage FluMu gp28-like protein
VRDIAKKLVPKVWFSSADESAAREYIEYCETWAKAFQLAAKNLGTEIIRDEKKDIKVMSILFADGRKINALSSNPKAFRSKEGKIVLDEFAHHDDPVKLWRAARPCIIWGYPLRILSTHNGVDALFAQFIERIKRHALNWSLHTTPIQQAVEEGLLDKIYGRATTKAEREEFLRQEREDCGDEETWLQEYCCIALDGASAFLTYDLISPCEDSDIIFDLDAVKGDLYLGMDIGRKKNLTCIWVLEKYNRHLYTRHFEVIEKQPFRFQKERLYRLLNHPNMRRACIDSTGIGMNLAEDAQIDFGQRRVEPVNFSANVKEDLATSLKPKFEDRQITIPADEKIREDLHSIKKVVTSSGNIRFDVSRSFKESHADRFWALALAVRADSESAFTSPPIIATRQTYQTQKLFSRF